MKSAGIAVLIALLTTGLLWPVEEAYDGAGLQWVFLWCLSGAGWLLHSLLTESSDSGTDTIPRNRLSERPDLLSGINAADFGILLLVGGQWISTAFVFSIPGDRRAALNLSFEWLALLIGWFLLRVLLQSERNRAKWTAALISAGVGIGAFGIWQHHVTHSEQISWYQSRRTELDQLQQLSDPSSLLRNRKITTEFLQNEIPLEGPSRILWEQRLLDSSEPTGPFALANTLSGLLLSSLLLLNGSVITRLEDRLRISRAGMLLTAVTFSILAYCLILTKCRTAWAGLGAGMVWLIVSRRRGLTDPVVRRFLFFGVLLTAVAAGVAMYLGALDREVVLEAVRSLNFRKYYWAGTIEYLKDHTLLGAGPGNFRHAYLGYKFPEASEEIRDPHNMILEAWTSGGVAGLCGILIILGAFLLSIRRTLFSKKIPPAGQSAPGLPAGASTTAFPHGADAISSSAARSEHRRGRQPARVPAAVRGIQSPFSRFVSSDSSHSVLWPLIAGFLLHRSWAWVNGADFFTEDPDRLMIPVLAGLTAWCIPVLGAAGAADCRTMQAAAIGLGVHLLGAGGFQMPGIMLILLSCICATVTACPVRPDAAVVPHESETRETGNRPQISHWFGISYQRMRPWTRIAAAAFCLLGSAGTVFLGVWPVVSGKRLVAASNYAQQTGSLREASSLLRAACSADFLAVNPRQRLAELETYRLIEAGRESVSPGSSSDGRQPGSDSLSGADLGTRFQNQALVALEACDRYVAADLTSVGAIRCRADCQWEVYVRNLDSKILGRVISDQEKVVQMYPSSAVDWYKLARSASRTADPGSGRLALHAAGEAMRLEALNQKWGHRDRYLSAEQISDLKTIIEVN
jgi:hypothetical protein